MLGNRIKPALSCRVFLLLAFVSACFRLATGRCIAAEGALEYEVKAAFLMNFTKFVEWPPSAFANAESPIAICIIGNDPFGHVLDDIVQGETVNRRRLTVRRIDEPPAPKTCQVLFIAASFKERHKLLTGLTPGVLTVSEGESFSSDGGMIAFVIDDRRVRFIINLAAAERAGLKLSSKLLAVAKAVEK
jgi:YfiR/HmsC-like